MLVNSLVSVVIYGKYLYTQMEMAMKEKITYQRI
jgi:hypothetical protein